MTAGASRAEFEPGELLARGPAGTSWAAYEVDGAVWAAGYADGVIVRGHPGAWHTIGVDGRKRPLAAEALSALQGCAPAWPPVLPRLAGLVEKTAIADEDGLRLTARTAAEVTPERPSWVWDRWLAAGALNMLPGRQGAGKSTFAAYIVGCASTGRPYPGDDSSHPLRRCGYLSHEESDGRVVARLAAAGADLARVRVLGLVQDVDDDGRRYGRPWQLPGDCDVLERRIRADRLGLVVVDGLGYSVRGDSHNYAVVGAALAGLAAVAEATGCAILGLTHPPKGASDPVTAAIGSTAWTAIPRVVVVLGRHPDDEQTRVVRVAKTNFAEPANGWSFRIAGDEEHDVGFVTGLRPCDVEAGSLVAEATTAEEHSAVGEAGDWLRAKLAKGPVAAEQLLAAAKADGIAERTLRRAKAKLGIPSHTPAVGSGWEWSLPEAANRDGQDGHSRQDGSLGSLGADQDVSSAQVGQDGQGCQAPGNGSLGVEELILGAFDGAELVEDEGR